MRKNIPDHTELDARTKRHMIRLFGYICQKCGSSKVLHLHHIIPVAAGGTNDSSNLGLLCRACHADWHHRVEPQDEPEIVRRKYEVWIMVPPTWFMIAFIERHGYAFTIEDCAEIFRTTIDMRRAVMARERVKPDVDYNFFMEELEKFETKTGANAIKIGIEQARERGTRLGRPPVDDAVIDRIRVTLAAGHGVHKTAKIVGCGVGTVQRVKHGLR